MLLYELQVLPVGLVRKVEHVAWRARENTIKCMRKGNKSKDGEVVIRSTAHKTSLNLIWVLLIPQNGTYDRTFAPIGV
jgi:hypothetical protein